MSADAAGAGSVDDMCGVGWQEEPVVDELGRHGLDRIDVRLARGVAPRRGQKSWDAGLGGTKRDGCGTHPGVCCGFARRRGPTVFKTVVPRFPPFGDCRGGVDGFDPLETRVYRAFVDHLREAL